MHCELHVDHEWGAKVSVGRLGRSISSRLGNASWPRFVVISPVVAVRGTGHCLLTSAAVGDNSLRRLATKLGQSVIGVVIASSKPSSMME